MQSRSKFWSTWYTVACSKDGSSGNSSAGRPFSLNWERPHSTVAWLRWLTSTWTSASGSSLMMLTSFLAGRVTVPSRNTFAGTTPVMHTSRSVAVKRTWPFSASILTLERMGSVVLEDTTLATCLRPSRNTCLEMVNFMCLCFYLPRILSQVPPVIQAISPSNPNIWQYFFKSIPYVVICYFSGHILHETVFQII